MRKRHVQLGLMNQAGTRIWKDPGKRARVLARRATSAKRRPGRPKKPAAGASHQAREAFKLAAAKLPMGTRFMARGDF